jgi:hypothetical protein
MSSTTAKPLGPADTKVTSPTVKQPTAPSKSLYKSFDASRTPITLLLKGPSGARKTTKAVQFPKPVLFNFDNNISGLRNLPPELVKELRIVNPQEGLTGDIKPIQIWDNFVKQLEIVMDDPSVKTIIIDSLTTLAERLLDKIVGSDLPSASVQIQHWGDFSKYLKWMGDELLCNPALDKNVIVIAHEQRNADGTYALAIGSRLKESFGLYFTDVWRCFSVKPVSGAVKYMVRVSPTQQFDAKCSLRDLPEEFEWEVEKNKVLSQITS